MLDNRFGRISNKTCRCRGDTGLSSSKATSCTKLAISQNGLVGDASRPTPYSRLIWHRLPLPITLPNIGWFSKCFHRFKSEFIPQHNHQCPSIILQYANCSIKAESCLRRLVDANVGAWTPFTKSASGVGWSFIEVAYPGTGMFCVVYNTIKILD